MRKCVVVHLTSVHSPFDTRIFQKECRSLAAAGYNVKLVTTHDRQETVDGVEMVPLPKPSRRLQRMTQTAGQVHRIALSLHADIYHFHDPELIPVGLLLVQQGYKVIYDSHEDAPRALLTGGRDYLPKQIERPASQLIEKLENFAARRFSAVVAATPAIARRFNRLSPNVVNINNYPILHELVASADVNWADREQAVAYVGGVAAVRGLKEMVEAVELLGRQRIVRLKIAGPFDSAQCRAEAMRMPGWQYTDELGYLNRTEVAALLATVRAGIVVFAPKPNHIEAQPNKLFEYMSAGIPVIASNFPLWRELIKRENCGLLVDPMDSAAIAEAMAYVLEHPTESETMGRNGRQAVINTYNWAVEEKKLLSLYAELLPVHQRVPE